MSSFGFDASADQFFRRPEPKLPRALTAVAYISDEQPAADWECTYATVVENRRHKSAFKTTSLTFCSELGLDFLKLFKMQLSR